LLFLSSFQLSWWCISNKLYDKVFLTLTQTWSQSKVVILLLIWLKIIDINVINMKYDWYIDVRNQNSKFLNSRSDSLFFHLQKFWFFEMIQISDLDFVISLICWEEKNNHLALLTEIFNIISEIYRKHIWFINMNWEFNLWENSMISNYLKFSLIQDHIIKHKTLFFCFWTI